MNKAFLTGMLVIFVMFSSNQAWAMGKRHSSGNSGLQHHTGNNPNGFSWHNTDDHPHGFPGNDNPGGGPVGNNNLSGPSDNDGKDCGFPSGVTVPEPATMFLMGSALAGGLLLRRKHA